MSDILTTLSTHPVLTNFAQDASQSAIKPIASFLAPTVEVPTMRGYYKKYDAKNRYKVPYTRRAPGGKATVIGFTGSDNSYALAANALDFPIADLDKQEIGPLLDQAKYGATLLADAAALAHESEVITAALAAVGAGTTLDFTVDGTDPIDVIDQQIQAVMLAARNGAGIRVLFGTGAFRAIKNNKNVRARFVSGGQRTFATPNLADLQAMLFGTPQCQLSLMVQDTAPEGAAAAMSFLLDKSLIVFAANDNPTTMDPSFMKTLRLMDKWMVPGAYISEDERDQFLKFDWNEQVLTTNSAAASRLNQS